MKVALFGGAFDPPHLGHKVVADSLINEKIVDEVWFVPVFRHPWADKYGKQQLADYDLRVKMLELLIATVSNRVSISEQAQKEVAKKQKVAHYKDVSFAFDTLEYFSKEFLEHDFSWVMGSEYLSRFDDFLKGHPQLIDYSFYIYPRAGYKLDDSLKKENMVFLSKMPEIIASSTKIKQLIKAGKDYSSMVPRLVEDIIKANSLYVG